MNLEEYGRMYEAEETQWWYAGMRAISLSLLAAEWPDGGAEDRRILDAGCGTGNNLAHFRRLGRTVGVDLSDEALRFCRSRGVAATRGSLLSLPFPDGELRRGDLVRRALSPLGGGRPGGRREIVRVMKPGGLFLVRVPALKMLWGAHDEAVHSRHRYTRGEVRRLLEGRGLEVLPDLCEHAPLPRHRGPAHARPLLHRHGSDVGFLPPPLEWAFRNLLGIEARLVRHLALPIGASVFAVARKPRAAAAAARG